MKVKQLTFIWLGKNNMAMYLRSNADVENTIVIWCIAEHAAGRSLSAAVDQPTGEEEEINNWLAERNTPHHKYSLHIYFFDIVEDALLFGLSWN